MKKILLLLLVLAAPAWAQQSVSTTIIVENEGSVVGRVRRIDCVGANINCTVAGGEVTVTISSGGGAVTMTEAEIDCGASATKDCTATVTDAGVSGTSKLLITVSGNAATGRQADENQMDKLVCSAVPGAGSFVVHCIPLPGPVSGKYKLFYTVG